MAGRRERAALGRIFGPGWGSGKPDVRPYFEYWRDTVDLIEEESIIKVKEVISNNVRNRFDHSTLDYEYKNFVIRRGQPFTIDIDFTRAWDPEVDDVRLVFQFGKEPKLSKRTDINLRLPSKGSVKGWDAKVIGQKDTTITVQVLTPPDCYVGKWSLNIDTVKRDEDKVENYRFIYESKIFVLFNAWCEEDTVYMDDETKRQEYVLEDKGWIFFSPKGHRKWLFGQFEENILECAMYLLDDHETSDKRLKDIARGDPVLVCRKISALVNSLDDDGVLTGNWSGDYEDGTSPLHWQGSVKILRQFFSTREAVCYGQCWVFSGVVTTLCRALGIPCRSVTNIDSAHDTDNSLTIDKYFDETLTPIKYLTSDSIWNFHVWNDVWMARPDLPEGFSGWQAIDATPQETSGGVFCMGPMSLKAIKAGELSHAYDGNFVYSEVNGDEVLWLRTKSGEFEVFHVNKDKVGTAVLTKKAGKDETENITSEYKHPESSKRDKAAAERAKRYADVPDEVVRPDAVMFRPYIPDTINLGENVPLKLVIKNRSDTEVRNITGKVRLFSEYYTGVRFRQVWETSVEIELQPNEVKEILDEIGPGQYYPHLRDFCQMRFEFSLNVAETDEKFWNRESFTLEKPQLAVKANVKTCKVGDTVMVDVSFTNPLDMTLTNCTLSIEGPGLQEPLTIRKKNVAAKGTFIEKVSIMPMRPGKKRQLLATFDCREMSGVEGDCYLQVTEDE